MYAINIESKNGSVLQPWVTFIQANDSSGLIGPPLAATYNRNALQNGISQQLGQTATISMGPTNWQGHLYFSDAALNLPKSSANCPTDPAYTDTTNKSRFQNLEFAGSSQSANVDITYINWYSIPLQMQSTSPQSSGGNTRGRPKPGSQLKSLNTTLAGLTNSNPATVVKNGSQIVRVISPNAGHPFWLPLYPRFSDYLVDIFIDSAKPPLLKNTYDGVQRPPSPDFQPQSYTVSTLTYGGQTLNIAGTSTVLGNFTMTSDMIFGDFSSAIYLAVMNYAWSYTGAGGGSNANGNTGDNNVFSAISRDLMAGFAYGFIGSTQYGAQPSSAWEAAPANALFSSLQPVKPYYNPWANAIYRCFSDVYSFPFNDFLTGSAPELAVNNGDTLTVTLLNPD